MTLCSPGPHVLLLVLQTEDFTQTDRRRLDYILHSLSEEPHKHILVIRTEKLQSDCSEDPAEETSSQSFITGCRYFQLNRESSSSDLVEMLKKIHEENGGRFLKWEEYKDAPCAPEQQQHDITTLCRRSQRLNVVLCGSNRVLKSPISDLILGQSELSPESSSEFVIRKAEVCGHLINLVELPALYNSQLSEEDVMWETLHCVSLCDPGIHAFLFIVPEGCLTNEDKGELKKMQRIFGSRIKNHTIAIITGSEQHAAELDAVTESIIQTFERQICVSDANMRSELLQQIEQIEQQNYTTMMFLETQVETQLKYKSEIESTKLSATRNETQVCVKCELWAES
ncbi:immune-associated nucleotide-binding protein 2-like [Astyanax mexicanus]|uniref:Immune-associated nucleotide-binding protein 2-like n=1 Tax=Astyanax mexicanus TaxID=7994 RepID=A0A8T2LY79_ASTMX|nr:immune-associated nucleotide-binding protein 2-like [Astyanax mexicanus]